MVFNIPILQFKVLKFVQLLMFIRISKMFWTTVISPNFIFLMVYYIHIGKYKFIPFLNYYILIILLKLKF